MRETPKGQNQRMHRLQAGKEYVTMKNDAIRFMKNKEGIIKNTIWFIKKTMAYICTQYGL